MLQSYYIFFLIISEIADIAVTESLSTVVMGNDINQSATRDSRLMSVSIVNGNYIYFTVWREPDGS